MARTFRFLFLLFPFVLFGQVRDIGGVKVSDSLEDVYKFVYITLERGGLDMTRVNTHLLSVTYQDTFPITKNMLTIGYTTVNSVALKSDKIYINNRAKGNYLLLIIMYHEMAHLLLKDLDCNRGLFLFSETLKKDYDSMENVLRLMENVDELIEFIKKEQKNDIQKNKRKDIGG